jgi:MFS family permease
MRYKPFWLLNLNRDEGVTFAAVFGGRVLDAMDSQSYALVLPALISVFALSKVQAGALGSVTAFVAAFATIAAGAAADRFGRLRVLQWSIATTAVATFFAAFAQNFVQLTILRAIQGMGYAAELIAAMTLINEAMRPELRGRAVSAVQCGYAVGYAIALAAMLIVFAFVPEQRGWRILFALGLLPAFYTLILQRFVPESSLFVATRKAAVTRDKRGSLFDVVRGENGLNTLITGLIAVGVYGASQIMIFWLPTFLRTAAHLEIAKTAGYLALNIAGSFCGPILYGPIGDRFGRRPVFLLFLALQAVSVTAYVTFASSLLPALVLGFVIGAIQGGLATGVQPIIAELFATSIRARALGVNGVFIRGIGALSPAVVGLLATRISLGAAMASVATVLYSAAAIGVLLVRETLGTDLAAVPNAGRAEQDGDILAAAAGAVED